MNEEILDNFSNESQIFNKLQELQNRIKDISDEYISTEECSRRLGVSDQTLRNWMAIGRKNPSKGWVEGIHYVNASPDSGRKALIRIPWNNDI